MTRLKMTSAGLEALAKELRVAGTGGAAFLATSGVLAASRTALVLGAVIWALFQGLALLVASIRIDDPS